VLLWYAHVPPRHRLPRSVVLSAIALVAAVSGCGRLTGPNQGPLRPTTLTFSEQPEYAVAGLPVGPGVAVTVLYQTGDTAYESSAVIRLAIVFGTGTAGAHLGGVTEMAAVDGTALFPSVSIDSAGSGYTLSATAPGLGSARSDTFTVTAGVPWRLGFGRQPSSALAGDTIRPAVQVLVQDSLGNTVPLATDAVSVALGANPGSATLSGTSVETAVAGVATFADLSVSAPGAGYRLVASATGLAPATSAPFTITAAARPGTRPPSHPDP